MIFAVLIAVLIISFFILWYRKNKYIKTIKKTIPNIEFGIKKEKLQIVHVSDLHFIDPKLTDSGKYFARNPEKDGRLIQYIDQIVDSFILEMIEKNPDLIIISGDLTYNGEKTSHEKLSKKLSVLKSKGIEVLLIPGNHDIDNKEARDYSSEEYEKVESISSEEFAEIYRDFGYREDEARLISRDKNSLSYMYMISPKQCVLMIESSYGKNTNYISNQTFSWIQKVLNIARENNLSVISVTHQNILAHNKMFIEGYKIENSMKLVGVLSEYNVRLNLSGHIHLQHISENQGVVDASVGCIALYPNLYANITVDRRDYIEYKTESLDISKWAYKYGWKNSDLLNFKEKSKEKFEFFGETMFSNLIKSIPASSEEKKDMEKFIIDSSIAYFSGNMDKYKDYYNTDNEIYKKWCRYCENTPEMAYLNSICTDNSKCHNKIRINL